jgi:hypothetical protein
VWQGDSWGDVEPLTITEFRPEGSDHKPVTQCKLLYDTSFLYGLFRVDDFYVRSVHTHYHAAVCEDSCVEFFVQPEASPGYLNFEFNAGGTIFCDYNIPTQVGRDKYPVSQKDAATIQIFHSQPDVVDPEHVGPLVWTLEFAIPLSLINRIAGSIDNPAGCTWRANFYKCGDKTSHPHWGAWSPVPEVNFHLPDSFGQIRFT